MGMIIFSSLILLSSTCK